MTRPDERVTQYQSIDEISPADSNPKQHADAQLQDSIRRFGFTEPVIIDERTSKLVSGHGRLEALMALREAGESPPKGISDDWQVPVVRGWSSANDAEAQAYLIAANRLTELGGWDVDALLDDLRALDDLTGVGYTAEEIDAQLHQALGSGHDAEPPDEFPSFDTDIETEHQCPKCGYEWSGKKA